MGISVALILCSFAGFGPIPGVPVIIFDLKPFWRVYTRLDVAVDAVVILSAAIALGLAASLRQRWIAPLLAVLAVIDGTAILPLVLVVVFSTYACGLLLVGDAPGWRNRRHLPAARSR